MSDGRIRNAVHELTDDYDALNQLLACYEAWGGQMPADGCALLADEPRKEAVR